MSGGGDGTGASRPALLCFDGSDDARGAIAEAGTVLGLDSAVVLTVWEPFANWEPYDPATILSAPVSRHARSIWTKSPKNSRSKRWRRGFRWPVLRDSLPREEQSEASRGG